MYRVSTLSMSLINLDEYCQSDLQLCQTLNFATRSSPRWLSRLLQNLARDGCVVHRVRAASCCRRTFGPLVYLGASPLRSMPSSPSSQRAPSTPAIPSRQLFLLLVAVLAFVVALAAPLQGPLREAVTNMHFQNPLSSRVSPSSVPRPDGKVNVGQFDVCK